MMEELIETKSSDIAKAFDEISLGFVKSRSASIQSRKQNLKKILNWILTNQDQVRSAIYSDFKKPKEEVDITEIFPVVSEIRYTLSNLSRWTNKKKVDTPLALIGSHSYIEFEPKGACLIIAPWNYPFELCIGPLVSCLAAGNTAIIKPSEATPHTAELVKTMISELFDTQQVQVITGDAEVSKELLQLPFDHVFFTGSPEIGKKVMQAAAQNLTSVTLELGGKSPAIIDKNCNIKDVAEKISWGKFINTGQTCVAPDYLLVHDTIVDVFVDELTEKIKQQFLAPQEHFIDSESFGRIVNHKNYLRLTSMLEESISEGAQVVFGENAVESENFIPPILIRKVSLNSRLMIEEIFGPILPIISYSTIDECVEIINDRPKPLALYYFGNDKRNSKRIVKETSSGNVAINDTVIYYGHHELPFGGVNHSGIGKSHGFYGFKAFSNEKGVLKQRVGLTSSKVIYPPYNGFKRRIIDLMKRFF